MRSKIFISVVVVVLFVIVVIFTTNDEDKVANSETQALITSRAIDVARDFKKEQFTIDYDESSDYFSYDNLSDRRKQAEEKYSEYVTESHMTKILMTALDIIGPNLAQDSKSNLSVKDISFKIGNMETESEVSLDYDIEIEFERIEQGSENKIISNFGQLRVIKTDDGWKVSKDIQRIEGLHEVR
ncbi:hypothetical protein [Virgibacillus sp. L01]|uniref:hypothetical protein n=1 Tax=Virgibacillus sp. L01 TaxID=3457429 RepID=UPI003FCFFC20